MEILKTYVHIIVVGWYYAFKFFELNMIWNTCNSVPYWREFLDCSSIIVVSHMLPNTAPLMVILHCYTKCYLKIPNLISFLFDLYNRKDYSYRLNRLSFSRTCMLYSSILQWLNISIYQIILYVCIHYNNYYSDQEQFFLPSQKSKLCTFCI